MAMEGCPFCNVPAEQVFHQGAHVQAVWDRFPVSPGHALLIPTRHVATWFEASDDEKLEVLQAIDVVKSIIDERYSPDGYNLGVNIGEAAGQTVYHLHIHIIPRYRGDMADPTGGVRHVIPEKGNYRNRHLSAEEVLGRMPHQGSLVRGLDDPLLDHLLAEIDQANVADIAVAFVQRSGVRPLLEHLRDLLRKPDGRVRLLTGDYLGITDPDALLELVDLQSQTERLELRVYETQGKSFHPKAYLFYRATGAAIAYVGSSNLTESALTSGVEWNYRVVSPVQGHGFAEVKEAFEELFAHRFTRPVDDAWIRSYRKGESQRRAAEYGRTREAPRARTAGAQRRSAQLAGLHAHRGLDER